MNGIGLTLQSIITAAFAIYCLWFVIKTIRESYGTNFQKADLTGAKFCKARMRNTNFTDATTRLVDWGKIDFKTPYFDITPSFQLLIDRDGIGQDYTGADLENEVLIDAHLKRANLSHSSLSGSNLTGADLRDANLTAAKAIGTNFTGVDFTNAIIQGWGITKDTQFINARCEYIYLRADRNPKSRKPLSGTFRPGEFAQIVTDLTEALDFILHRDDDPKAFFNALGQMMQTYGDQGIQPSNLKKLDNGDRHLTFDTPPDFDNATVHAETLQNYETQRQELAACHQEIQSLQRQLNNTSIELTTARQEIQNRMDQIIKIQQQHNQSWRENSQAFLGFFYDKIPTLPIGDNVNVLNPDLTGSPLMAKHSQNIQGNSGDVSGVAGRDIVGVAGKDQQGIAGRDLTGEVTIAINALRDEPAEETVTLADRLEQLQAEISKSDAGEKQKKTLLTQVKKLAELAKLPTSKGVKEAAEESIGFIESITEIIPKLGKAVKGILGAIASYFTNLG